MGAWQRVRAGWVAGAALLGVVGCADTLAPKATVVSPEGKSIEEARQEAYDGPKARVAVTQFKDKTGKGWWTGRIGDGMADMLASALFHSNRYIVLERQTLSDVLYEQDLGAAGRIKRGTEAPVGEIEGAELLIVGAVTEFEGAASGVGGGIGGIGGSVGRVLGGLAGGIQNAHMAIDVRVVDAKTSRILAATTVEGKATDVSLGGALAGAGGGGALGGALAGWSKTPTEKALRICIQEAVRFVVSKTPAAYYRHKPTAVATAASASSQPASGPALPDNRRVIKSIRTDADRNVIADLNEVTRRGAVLTVVVTVRFVGDRAQSEYVHLYSPASKVMDYRNGDTYPVIKTDGWTAGNLKRGEARTFRVNFEAPKAAQKVGVILSGIGTFDDVTIESTTSEIKPAG